MKKMYPQELSDKKILEGFRKGDAAIIREYFYGYCYAGYCVFDQRYQLSSKQNLDFMSMAHQYALYLMEHNWQPLEDHSPKVSMKTWLINGFRYVVLFRYGAGYARGARRACTGQSGKGSSRTVDIYPHAFCPNPEVFYRFG